MAKKNKPQAADPGFQSAITATQMRMINAYLEVASDEGVHRATLQKVAKKAGVPFATAHYHFGNDPDALLEMSMLEISNRARAFTLERLARGQKSGLDPVRSYAEATFAWTEHQALEAQLWLFSYYRAGVSQRSRENQALTLQVARDRVYRLLCEGVGSGEIRMKAKPTRELGDALHTLVFAYGIQAIIALNKAERNRLKQACMEQIDCLLDH